MRVFVIPHNHWIGYHVVTRFLDDGCQVDGIRDSQIRNGLADFYGRNSHFNEIEQAEKEYDLAIIINHAAEKQLDLHAGKIIQIQTDSRLNIPAVSPKATVISVPYLIGEGMEMDEHGLLLDEKGYPFAEKEWQHKAIYIKDFLKILMQWIKMKQLPARITIVSINNNLTNTKVEKKQILLENRDIDAVIRTIQRFNKQLR